MPKLLPLLAALIALPAAAQADEWPAYGRDPGGARYSPLRQVNTVNVGKLTPAWTFHTGDIADGSQGPRSGFETTPLFLDGRLYLTTPFNRIIALDPGTGRQLWAYDPVVSRLVPSGDGLINRGLAAWRDPKAKKGAACALTLYEATLTANLVAVDAVTGKPCAGFGDGGKVSLREVKNFRVGQYHMSSPPVVVDDVVVVGSAIDDNGRAEMPGGVIRGFDARTGKQLWAFEPLEKPADVPDAAWRTGAGNAWSIPIADPRRHLVLLPTGSASPDYYGGLRPGDNRWANSVIALDARTGKLKWGFQLVHHDLWDYDVASPPLAAKITIGGRKRDAVVAGNKSGLLYVLDPDTGAPLLPVEERPAPKSDIPGELSWPTQPFTTSLPPLVPTGLSPKDAFGLNEADRAYCAAEIAGFSGAALFTPPSVQGIAAVPGNIGGLNWSGMAFDDKTGRLIVTVTNLPFRVRLIPRETFEAMPRGSFRAEVGTQTGTPYAMVREPIRAPSGMFCTPPPYGEILAIDLGAGKIAWRKPLGSLEEVIPGIAGKAPGSIVLGGPIVTAGGLIFIGGTSDRTFRALSAATGEELWSAQLPASAHATPMTYEWKGKQYVVIAAGGGAKITEERQSDALIAYALP